MLTEPVALAPEAGREQAVGEVSARPRPSGSAPGCRSRRRSGAARGCSLSPPDPGRAASEWERVVRALEGIGAGVESERAGEAYFGVDGLRGLWGPSRENVLARAARAIGRPARIAGAPTRFCAFAAASTMRPGRRRRVPPVVGTGREREFLAPLPVALLDGRLRGVAGDRGGRLVATLERLGVGTLGELAALPRVAVADRFGRSGSRRARLASGLDEPLRPRRPPRGADPGDRPARGRLRDPARARARAADRAPARRPAPPRAGDPLAAAGGAPRPAAAPGAPTP